MPGATPRRSVVTPTSSTFDKSGVCHPPPSSGGGRVQGEPPNVSYDDFVFRLSRFETFNMTNSLRPGDPNTEFGASGFGQMLAAADPRLLQFSLKYLF